MRKPRLLDLFCCAGGAGMGYHRAGFEVVGVDINPSPRYPFEFHQADAMTFPLDNFDVIHASPPCQAYSIASKVNRDNGIQYPDMLPAVRDRFIASGKPWIIENVPGAPMRADYIACGSHFSMRIIRHRWFEFSWGPILHLSPPCSHAYDHLCVVGQGTPSNVRNRRKKMGLKPDVTLREYREVMGCEWMDRRELSQCIPPAYTEFIARQWLRQEEASDSPKV